MLAKEVVFTFATDAPEKKQKTNKGADILDIYMYFCRVENGTQVKCDGVLSMTLLSLH